MRTPIRFVCVIAALLPFGADTAAANFSPARAAKACPDASAAPTKATIAQAEAAVLCLINRERGLRGLRRVRRTEALDRAAGRHSDNMNDRDFFAHQRPGGRSPQQRVRAAGYAGSVGENIAWGGGRYATPLETMRGWMNSPGHRTNILRRGWRHVGIGIDLGAPMPGISGGATYTTDFGAR